MTAPLDVRCPTCASAPGTRCYDGAAPKSSPLFHKARIEAAKIDDSEEKPGD